MAHVKTRYRATTTHTSNGEPIEIVEATIPKRIIKRIAQFNNSHIPNTTLTIERVYNGK